MFMDTVKSIHRNTIVTDLFTKYCVTYVKRRASLKMFWGLTPALDLLEEFQANANIPDELNILLTGGADCRHVLKTIARSYRYSKVNLNFYIVEACPETIAKQMLLLYIALQPEEELGLIQKTRYFMEIYGNSLVRPAVAKYLSVQAREFVNMITNYDYMKQIIPYMNVDLKYKERDYIENVFKFWCSSDEFDICDCWDRRLRKHLGIRYDSKKGVFDWDLHMRFHNLGGGLVGNQEYQSFRTNGVAFSWLESEVSKSNRSMVCGLIPNGKNYAHYGYLGEMQTGPFVSFGLDCEDKDFLKKTNNMYMHRATDITERNLREIFYEIHNKQTYVHCSTNDLKLGCVVTNFNDVKVCDSGDAGITRKKKIKTCIALENVTLNFLSISMLPLMKHKEKYNRFFDLIYFNFTYLKYFEQEVITNIAKSGSLLIIENQIFVLNNREKELDEYKENIFKKMDNLKREDLPFNVTKDYYAKFILKS